MPAGGVAQGVCRILRRVFARIPLEISRTKVTKFAPKSIPKWHQNCSKILQNASKRRSGTPSGEGRERGGKKFRKRVAHNLLGPQNRGKNAKMPKGGHPKNHLKFDPSKIDHFSILASLWASPGRILGDLGVPKRARGRYFYLLFWRGFLAWIFDHFFQEKQKMKKVKNAENTMPVHRFRGSPG